MRTRTLITGVAFLAAGLAGARQASAQALAGSDTLENVTEQVITACGVPTVSYIGGGSGAGQAAMAGGSQHVASMSRQLNGSQCTANSRQLLIGLDGLSIVVKNGTHESPDVCTDDLGSGPLVLTGIPTQFVTCSAQATCTTLFGAGSVCDTTRQFCQVGGTLLGCTAAQGCLPDGTYTFNTNDANAANDWQDVLRVVYGGMFHGNAMTGTVPAAFVTPAAGDPNAVNADGTAVCFGQAVVADGPVGGCGPGQALCPAGQFCNAGTCSHQVANATARVCVRNPLRIDCASPVRGVLLASYSQFIRTPRCTQNQVTPPVACTSTADCPASSVCNTTVGQCVSEGCVKIKHAFRRDDLSGTTDAFQALVGLQALPPFTTLRSTTGAANAPEIADFAATVSPFCNGGTQVGNKGFSDGQDMDPIRRFCNSGPAPDRIALASVCQAWSSPLATAAGDAGCYVSGGTPATYPQRERSAQQGRGFVAGGSLDTIATFQTEYLAQATRPRCLGVVQPVSIPQDTNVGTPVWATNRFPQGGNCTAGVRAFVNPLPARQILCPDGAIKAIGATCRLPQNTSNNRFDCVTDSPVPGGTVQDARVYNLMPVNTVGNMAALVDSYGNPGFPDPTAGCLGTNSCLPGVTNLRRFGRRYYAIHMARPDNSKKQATIATGCQFDDDTRQIGCLVKADPCSIGFAGAEAADNGAMGAPFNNLALRIMGIQSTTTNVQNLATGGVPVYPMARKLWFNSFNNNPTANQIGFLTPNLTAGEQTLSTCMGLPALCAGGDIDCGGAVGSCNAATGRCRAGNIALIDAAIAAFGFTQVPATVERLILHPTTGNGCPLP